MFLVLLREICSFKYSLTKGWNTLKWYIIFVIMHISLFPCQWKGKLVKLSYYLWLYRPRNSPLLHPWFENIPSDTFYNPQTTVTKQKISPGIRDHLIIHNMIMTSNVRTNIAVWLFQVRLGWNDVSAQFMLHFFTHKKKFRVILHIVFLKRKENRYSLLLQTHLWMTLSLSLTS